MTFLFANNARTTLAQSLTATGTSVSLASGEGDQFPSPGTGEMFALFITSASSSSQVEVCYCTARNGDTLTVNRGMDGTSAQTFSAGDYVTLGPVAGVNSIFAQAGDLGSYSSATASDIGGYALNALIADATTSGLFWRSTVAANTTVPGASGASWGAVVLDQTLLGWTQINASQYLTAPVWARYIEVIQIGGGGGGTGCQGNSTTETISGSGGGGGGVLRSRHPISFGAVISQYIGAGGAGGSGATSGHSGGDTYLIISNATVARAGGGVGGTAYAAAGTSGGGGGTNSLTSGLEIGNYTGSDGCDGQAGPWQSAGMGAPGYLGAGSGRAGSGGGQSATSAGAGGGGAYDGGYSGTSFAGGSGASGACLYRWIP